MSFWTLNRIGDAVRGFATGHLPAGEASLGAVTTDTRTITAGDVFVALKGERFDAHDFLDEAVQRGAKALVVTDPRRAARAGVPVVAVADTVLALGALGRYRRRVWGKTVIAVAGSNGKTSTKELIRAAVGATYEVHATRGNLNNQVGVPLTLLSIPDTAGIAVIEIGTNHPGEVDALRALAEPDIAVLTSIGEEHLEGLIDLAGVLREESAVFRDVDLAITPASQPEVAAAARGHGARQVVSAGIDSGDLRTERWSLDATGRGQLVVEGVTVTVPLPGEHNVRNTMLALAVARACGVSLEEAARGIATMAPLAMRSAWESVGAVSLLNDAYNANPASAREVIRLLGALPTERQRVLVLGTMLELGSTGPALHDEIARLALASGVAIVAGIGEFDRALRDVGGADPRIVRAPDLDAIWPLLAPRLSRDAVIALKGSRGMRLERLIPHLTAWSAST